MISPKRVDLSISSNTRLDLTRMTITRVPVATIRIFVIKTNLPTYRITLSRHHTKTKEADMDRRELLTKTGIAAAGALATGAIASKSEARIERPSGGYFGMHGDQLLSGFDPIADNESLIDGDLKDQFLVFQLMPTKNQKWYVRSPQEIEPRLETNEQYPDIVLDTRLLSFHLGGEEKVSAGTKATVRITFGGDQNTERARRLGANLYWGITSGLNLWNTRGLRAQPADYRSDFRQIFGNKYVELPGGAGSLKVEIVKHETSSWWEKAFRFSSSGTGAGLISALGFPGVTSRVLNFVDDAANRFVGDNATVIFSSRGLPLAFTKQARNEISSTGTRIGSLNTGVWIFARGRDLPILSEQEMTYDATLRRLFPADSKMSDVLSGKAVDPLRNITYAILSSRLKRRKITVGF